LSQCDEKNQLNAYDLFLVCTPHNVQKHICNLTFFLVEVDWLYTPFDDVIVWVLVSMKWLVHLLWKNYWP